MPSPSAATEFMVYCRTNQEVTDEDCNDNIDGCGVHSTDGKRGAARRWGEEAKDTAPVASDSEGRASDNSDIANDSKNSNAILPIASDSKNSQAEAEAEAEAYTEADSSFLAETRKEPKEFPAGSRAQEKTLLVALGCGKTHAPPTPVGEVVRSGARASPERADRWDYERQRWVMDGG